MIKIYPFIFVILWSSAFVTTKPIIDNSDPFAALAFRFFFVALGFFLFAIYKDQKILTTNKNLLNLFLVVFYFMEFILGVFFTQFQLGCPRVLLH